MLSLKSIAQTAGLVLPAAQLTVIQAALAGGVRAFLLEGEPGTGKTHLGRSLGGAAAADGGHFLFAQANAWASDEFLIRGVDLAGFVENDPNRVYADGALLRAARLAATAPGRLSVAIIDEWDKTRPVADGLLLAALEERVIVDAAGVHHADVPPTLVWWITSNASRDLHPALLRRLLRLRLTPPPDDVLEDLIQDRANVGRHLAATLTAMRRTVAGLTLPDLVRLATVARRLPDVDACRFLVDPYVQGGDRDVGADVWAAIRRDQAEAAR